MGGHFSLYCAECHVDTIPVPMVQDGGTRVPDIWQFSFVVMEVSGSAQSLLLQPLLSMTAAKKLEAKSGAAEKMSQRATSPYI